MSAAIKKQALAAARENREDAFKEAFDALSEEEKQQVLAQISSEFGESHPFIQIFKKDKPPTQTQTKRRRNTSGSPRRKGRDTPQQPPQPETQTQEVTAPPEESKPKPSISGRDLYKMSLPIVRNLVLQRMNQLAQARSERFSARAEAMRLGGLSKLTQTKIDAEPLSISENAPVRVRVGALPEWLAQLRQAGISVRPSQAVKHLEEGLGMEATIHLRPLKGKTIGEQEGLPVRVTISDVQIQREKEGEWTVEVRGEINDPEGTVKGPKNVFYRFPVKVEPLQEWQETEEKIEPLAGWRESEAAKTPIGQFLSALLTQAEPVGTQSRMKAQEGTTAPVLHTTFRYRAQLPPEKYGELLKLLALHKQFGDTENEPVKFHVGDKGVRFESTFPYKVQSEGQTLHTEMQTIELEIPAPSKAPAASQMVGLSVKRLLGTALVTVGNLLPAITMGAVGFGFPIIGRAMKKMSDIGLSLLAEESTDIPELQKYVQGKTETLPFSEKRQTPRHRRFQKAFRWLAGESEDFIRKLAREDDVDAELRSLLANIKNVIDKAYGQTNAEQLLQNATPVFRQKIFQTLINHPVGLSAHPAYSTLLELASISYTRAGSEEKKLLSELLHMLTVGIALTPKVLVPYMLAKNLQEGNLRTLLSEIVEQIMPEHSLEERNAWASKAYARVNETLTTPELRIVLTSGRSLHLLRQGSDIIVRLGKTTPPQQALHEVLGNAGHVPHIGVVGIGAVSPQQRTEISSFAGAVYAVMPFAIRELFLKGEEMQKGSLRMPGELLAIQKQGLVDINMEVPVSAEQEERMARFVLAKDIEKASLFVIEQMRNVLEKALPETTDPITANAIVTAKNRLLAVQDFSDGESLLSTWYVWGTSFESVDNIKTLASSYLSYVRNNDNDNANLLLIRAAGRLGNPNDNNIAYATGMSVLSLFRVGYPFRKIGQGYTSVPHIAHMIVSLAKGGIEHLYGTLLNGQNEETREALRQEAKAVILWLHGQIVPKGQEKVEKDISLPATIRALSTNRDAYDMLAKVSKRTEVTFGGFQQMTESDKTRYVLSALTDFINTFTDRFFLREYAVFQQLATQDASQYEAYPLTAWRIAWKKAWQGKGDDKEALALWNTFPRLALAEMFSITHLAAEAGIIPQSKEHDMEDLFREMAQQVHSKEMPYLFPEMLRRVYGENGLLSKLQKATVRPPFTGIVNHPNGLNAFFIKMCQQSSQNANFHLVLPFATQVTLSMPEVSIFHPDLVGCTGMGYKTTSYVRSLYARFDFTPTDTVPLGFDAPVDQQIYRSIATHATSDAYVSMPSVGGLPAEYIAKVRAKIVTPAKIDDMTSPFRDWLKAVYQFHDLGRNAFREVFLAAAVQNAHLLWHEDEIAETIQQTEVGKKYPLLVDTIRQDFRNIRETLTNMHLEIEKTRLAKQEQKGTYENLSKAWENVLALRVHPLSHLLFHHAIYEMAQASQRNPLFGEHSSQLAKTEIDKLRPALLQIAQSREIPLRLLNASIEMLSALQQGDEQSLQSSIESITQSLSTTDVHDAIRQIVRAVYAKLGEKPIYSTVSYRIHTD